MPKTANKRADARRVARVQQAHQMAPEPVISRRIPAAAHQNEPRGPLAVIRDYPWASTLFVALVIAVILLVLHGERLGPWAPAAAQPAASCNLKTHVCNHAPKMTIDLNKVYTATIKTAKGDIVMELDTANAANNVNNFVWLADQHFYDGLPFWRVETVNQVSAVTGVPSSIGIVQGGAGGKNGGPGYTIANEPPPAGYVEGTVAMANGSQFFISTVDNTQAIANSPYPVIGKITSGLDVAKSLTVGDVIQTITITVSNPTPTPAPSPTSTALPTAVPTNTP
ncbi:MAG: hypothetical protein OJF49_001829 [Ktedonobacterales bacterium]|jgi:peptidylprolyl isomerase|nr:MAG: hypothetical protein OJF49_001829 [Ktedonobacterales bacterium]